MPAFIDLTLEIGDSTPGPPSVGRAVEFHTYRRGPGHWQATRADLVLHTGTHMDFSRHCEANGETSADVTLDRTCGPALVIDVSHAGPNHEISLADVEEGARDLRPGDIALVRTDWTDRHWGDFPAFYLESPYCAREAIDFLASLRLRAVGFDCFVEYAARLPDFGSEDFFVHKVLFDQGALLFQLLTGLGRLPVGQHLRFFGTFPRIRGAEGVPARYFVLQD